MIVVKFGGTSVGDADAIERAASIVRERLHREPVVVVSAMSGVTNTLIDIAQWAVEGQLILALRGVEALRERHLAEAERLIADRAARSEVCEELSALCDDIASLADALRVLGHLTPRSQDALAAYGEQLSSALIVQALRERDVPAELVDARQVIITDDHFSRAAPDQDAIARTARDRLLPLIDAGSVPLLGGFIGATALGVTTTLGRGGSDYTASLIGAALDAQAIEIWTDVDGMLTADPRIVSGARLIERIRFDEASELASFGAKVLHPATIAPAVRRGIPVHIFNSRRPHGTGTLITNDAPPRQVRAIAGKSGVTVVKIRSTRMLLAHGFLRRLFETFERHRTSVDVVATSEVSVSVTVDDTSRLESLVLDLTAFGDVSVERNRSILALVGASLGGESATMARALVALGDIRVHMMSLSATEINLTFIVNEDAMAPAMCRLHEAFFGAHVADEVNA